MTEPMEQPEGQQPKRERKSRRSGQIIQRGENKWLVRIYLGRNETTGQRDYFNQTIRGTKKDAQKFLNAKQREIDLGVFVEPAAESLDAYLDRWLKTAAKPKLRERTYDDYEALLRRYVRGPLGKRKLANIRPLDIQEVYSEMQERGLSPRVIRYTHSILSSAFKQAMRWGFLAQNPAQLVQLPRQKRREMSVLSAEQTAAFLRAVEGQPHELLFAFALATGMRPEEYLALQWGDLDLERGSLSVQRSLVRKKGGGWEFEDTKTPQGRRVIPFPSSLVMRLRQHRRTQMEARLKLGNEYQNYDLVFAAEIGTPIGIQNLTMRHFKPALERAGLPSRVRLYDLRHTCATLLLLAGEHPKVVSERLGHADIRLTLDTYSHVLPDMQRGAADKLEKLLFETA